MGSITALWLPCAILAHVFGLVCLVVGPLRLWLNAQGGTKAVLARRRGSVPGQLPKAHDSDDEDLDSLAVDAIARPAQQHQQQASGATAAEKAKSGGSSKKAGDHHQVERVQLEWQSIHCSYAAGNGKVSILHDVWGKAEPGEMQVGWLWLAVGVVLVLLLGQQQQQ